MKAIDGSICLPLMHIQIYIIDCHAELWLIICQTTLLQNSCKKESPHMGVTEVSQEALQVYFEICYRLWQQHCG